MLFENNAAIREPIFQDTAWSPEGRSGQVNVIVVDYDPPTYLDENNINGHILFGMTGTRCCDDGR